MTSTRKISWKQRLQNHSAHHQYNLSLWFVFFWTHYIFVLYNVIRYVFTPTISFYPCVYLRLQLVNFCISSFTHQELQVWGGLCGHKQQTASRWYYRCPWYPREDKKRGVEHHPHRDDTSFTMFAHVAPPPLWPQRQGNLLVIRLWISKSNREWTTRSRTISLYLTFF